MKEITALPGIMRYTISGQDAHPTKVSSLWFVPHSNEICCMLFQGLMNDYFDSEALLQVERK